MEDIGRDLLERGCCREGTGEEDRGGEKSREMHRV